MEVSVERRAIVLLSKYRNELFVRKEKKKLSTEKEEIDTLGVG